MDLFDLEDLLQDAEQMEESFKGAARLRTLVHYLENIPSKRFGMDRWAWADVRDPVDQTQLKKMIFGGSCGTTACACGHAAMIPEFQKLGFTLHLEVDDDGEVVSEIVYKTKDDTYYGFEAAEMFFGLESVIDAQYLFSPVNYDQGRAGRSYVIRRIKTHINKLERQKSNVLKELAVKRQEIEKIVERIYKA